MLPGKANGGLAHFRVELRQSSVATIEKLRAVHKTAMVTMAVVMAKAMTRVAVRWYASRG